MTVNFCMLVREEIAVYFETGKLQINANVWENHKVF
jgi:hypothetical protein